MIVGRKEQGWLVYKMIFPDVGLSTMKQNMGTAILQTPSSLCQTSHTKPQIQTKKQLQYIHVWCTYTNVPDEGNNMPDGKVWHALD